MLHEAQRARPMSCPFIRPQWLGLAIPCHPPGCLASLEKASKQSQGCLAWGYGGASSVLGDPGTSLPPSNLPPSLLTHPAWGASYLMAIRAFLILKDPCSGLPDRCVEAGDGGPVLEGNGNYSWWGLFGSQSAPYSQLPISCHFLIFPTVVTSVFSSLLSLFVCLSFFLSPAS